MFQPFLRDGVRRRPILPVLLAGVLSAALGGCSDHRPKYAMPKRPLNEVAVVVAEYNILSSFSVDEVDGARVEAPPFSVNYPVKVLPGERRLKVSGATGRTRAQWSFVYNFQAGHRYALSASSAVFQTGLKLTDKTTNTSTIIR
jgi:hypothetical protein